jgi:hypothetical protein
LILAFAWLIAGQANGQDLPALIPHTPGQPLLPLDVLYKNCGGNADNSANRQPLRFPLFRMPAGFLYDPVGLDTDDDNPAAYFDAMQASSSSGGLADLGKDGRLGFALGSDNPYFDFREAGDPGGVGYYRFQTQCLLVDNESTCLSLGVRGAMPAGREGDGVPGPTVFSPHLACFHELDNGLAFQGFVGKHVPAHAGWTDNLDRGVHYGVALQSAVPNFTGGLNQDVHLFVEALGKSRRTINGPQDSSSTWGVIPGLHWKLGDNWWMSSGIRVPVGAAPVGSARNETGRLQFTCGWRF